MFSSPYLTLPVVRLLKTMFLESYLKVLFFFFFALTHITYSHKSLMSPQYGPRNSLPSFLQKVFHLSVFLLIFSLLA